MWCGRTLRATSIPSLVWSAPVDRPGAPFTQFFDELIRTELAADPDLRDGVRRGRHRLLAGHGLVVRPQQRVGGAPSSRRRRLFLRLAGGGTPVVEGSAMDRCTSSVAAGRNGRSM